VSEKQYDWAAIAKYPKFIELCQKKNTFLYLWWLVGTLIYFLLLVGAGYTPELFKIKLIGRINVGYAIFTFNFIGTWAIALYYAYKADNEFDRMALELFNEVTKEDNL
jgi:uncharacterized membrane protein (DUF485 family)